METNPNDKITLYQKTGNDETPLDDPENVVAEYTLRDMLNEAITKAIDNTTGKDIAKSLKNIAHSYLSLLVHSDEETAKNLRLITDEMMDNPYTKETFEFFSGDNPTLHDYDYLLEFYPLGDKEALEMIDKATNGGISRLFWIEQTILRDFYDIGKLITDNKITFDDVPFPEEPIGINAQYFYLFALYQRGYGEYITSLKNAKSTKPNYSKVKMTKALGQMLRVGKHSNIIEEKDIYKGSKKITHIKEQDFTLSFMESNPKSWKPSTRKLLMLLNREFTMGDYRAEKDKAVTVGIQLSEFMKVRGLTSKEKARKSIRADLKALESFRATFESNDKRNFANIGISGGFSGISDDVIFFTFNYQAIKGLLSYTAATQELNDKCFSIPDDKYPNAFNIYLELVQLGYMNAGDPNENKISIKNLVGRINDLPNPEKIKDRSETRLIMKPLERDLNALVEYELLQKWEYVGEKDKPLSDKQQSYIDQNKVMPWNLAKNLYIVWAFKDKDGQVAKYLNDRIERKDQKRIKAAQQKEAAEKELAKREERRKKEEDKEIGKLRAKVKQLESS